MFASHYARHSSICHHVNTMGDLMNQLYIADDNTDFAKYVARVASSGGWEVETCENGRALLERLATGDGPAFLLIDINMPEMDGIEAIEGLAELDRPLRLRFITGGTDAAILAAKMIAQARNLTVGRNVYKPIGKQDLTTLLHEEAEALEAL